MALCKNAYMNVDRKNIKIEKRLSDKFILYSGKVKWIIPFTIIMSFILPAILVVIAYAMNKIWPGSEKTVLISDLKALNFPLAGSLRYVISGDSSIFYQTNSLLGSGNISTYMSSYSGLFAWAMGMFPYKMLPDVLYFIEVVEIGLCGLTCCLYFCYGHFFRFFIKDKNIEYEKEYCHTWIIYGMMIVLSSLYALCSYNIVYFVNMPWINISISLPLIMLGMDFIIDSHQKCENDAGWKSYLKIDIRSCLLLIFSFAYSLYSCYYITYASGIFGLMYFLLRVFDYNRTELSFKFVVSAVYKCGISIILGTCIVMPLLLPALLSLNKSEVYLLNSNFEMRNFFHKNPLVIFSRFLPDADAEISDGSGLPFIYCGVVSILLFAVYFFIPQINRSQKILAGLIFSFYIASLCFLPLYALWHGGRVPNWHPGRFTYTFSFFIILIAFRTCCILYVTKINCVKPGSRENILKICVAFALVYVLSESLLNASVVFSKLNIYYVYNRRETYEKIVDDISPISFYINKNDPFYRMINPHTFTQNDSAFFGYNGFGYFNSTFNQFGAGAFYKLGTMTFYNYSLDYGFSPIVMDLFGYKYIVYNSKNADIIKRGYGTDEVFSSGKLNLGANYDALPIGFLASEKCNDTQKMLDTDEFENQNIIISDLCGMELSPLKSIEFIKSKTIEEDGAEIATLCFSPRNDNGVWLFIEDNYYDGEIEEEKKTIEVSVEGSDDSYAFEAGVCAWAVFLDNFFAGEEVCLNIKSYYPYGDIRLAELDFDELRSGLETLKKNTLDVNEYKKGKLSGKIIAEKDGILFFSIPYENGYKLFVDGIEREPDLYRGVFLCTDLSKGEHDIELVFVPPGLVAGITLCIISLAVIIIMVLSNLRNIKNK